MRGVIHRVIISGFVFAILAFVAPHTSISQKKNGSGKSTSKVLTGQGAAGDWTTDAPGVRRRITVADLPKPYQTESVRNGPKLVRRPDGALPVVPSCFRVEQFASGFKNPPLLRVAPNGDIFVAESRAHLVRVIRPSKDHPKPEINEVIAAYLKRPFGISSYPSDSNTQYLYIGHNHSIIRFLYHNGDLEPRGKAEVIVPDIPGWGELTGGGHWTRDIAFSAVGKKVLVSVGSLTNVHENPGA